MKKVCWPYFDPEFDKLPERLYGPPCRVCIDNESLEDCTVVKVDSMKEQGLLLEVVQILTDMNLTISKSYISSDAGWFMDVFHVKDKNGNKLRDANIINYIKQAIGATRPNSSEQIATSLALPACAETPGEYTAAIEMTGADRPGLLSEISAALADLRCNIVEAHAWSHNARLACVAYISDSQSSSAGSAPGPPISDDPCRLAFIEHHLNTVLCGAATTATTSVGVKSGTAAAATTTSVERRLHQLMLSVRDFDSRTTRFGPESGGDKDCDTSVKIESCEEKEYSIVSVECRDRPRLMFDTICTLIDLNYLIFHASLTSNQGFAFQEYFIRHMDGKALSTENDKERIIRCLEAAIERRVCQGIRLDLRAENRVGLLSDITRVLRENGLAIVRADVATRGEKAINAFYVRDVTGNDQVDLELVESMKKDMSPMVDLQVITNVIGSHEINSQTFSLSDKLKTHIQRFFHNSFLTLK